MNSIHSFADETKNDVLKWMIHLAVHCVVSDCKKVWNKVIFHPKSASKKSAV